MEVKGLTFALVISILISEISTKKCSKVSVCSCREDSGFVVDLSPLAKTDGTPRFVDITDSKGKNDLYSWNPCNDFTEGTCVNQAACKVTPSGMITQYLGIGTQDTASFSYDADGRLNLQYTADGALTSVQIFCSKGEEASITAYAVDKDKGQTEYYFQLETKYACVHIPISVGTILCIGFVAAVFIYLIVGISFQIFIRKESGRRVVPNYDTWVSIPSLIRDGVLFIVRRGKRDPNYDKI